MTLEKEAEVKQRRLQQPPMLKKQGDEQATDAAIAIEIGMDGFELHMGQTCPYQRGQVVLRMHILLERPEQVQTAVQK